MHGVVWKGLSVLACAAVGLGLAVSARAADDCKTHARRNPDGTYTAWETCPPGMPPGGPGWEDWARPQDVADLPLLVRSLKQTIAAQTGATGADIRYEGVRTYLAFVDGQDTYVSFCGRLTYLNVASGRVTVGHRFFVAKRVDGSQNIVFDEEDTADPHAFEQTHRKLCRGRQGPGVWR